MWVRSLALSAVLLGGVAVFSAHAQGLPQMWFSGDGVYAGASLVEVVQADGDCFVAPTGEMSCRQPPRLRACASCAAPAWHPPMTGDITLCAFGGACQRYVQGQALGAPWQWWEQR